MRLLLLRLALLLVIGIDTGLLLTPVRLFFINAQYGCWPWSPAEVFYRDGMTLCPGQTARIKIPLPAPTDKGI